MNNEKEAIEALNRAEAKFKIAVNQYPMEMLDISKIIEYSDSYTSEEVLWAFTRLQEIINEIRL